MFSFPASASACDPIRRSWPKRRSAPAATTPWLPTEHAGAFRHDDQVLIFTNGTGEPIRRGAFRSRVWKPSLQRAGLPAALRFHDIRRSYATWLVSDGVPINDVAKVMGHATTGPAASRRRKT
ncbi:tyrosine-type recombinase/integrase [Micromonospora sp. A200]|uniref:tyrosine-type recombinase/integrase n=1 Tax=Micromonospora sp. A200 TaxID=2940568 RepID=UPI002476CDC6|nr:tyrosine-type recombinase/integrase [Micromonospora sp. A200]